MANILKVHVKDEINNAMNSTKFSNYIRNLPIEDDKTMVSLDNTFLYANILITDTLNMKIMLIMKINSLGKQLYLKTSFLTLSIWFSLGTLMVRNLHTGSWINCYVYSTTPSKSLETFSWWLILKLNILGKLFPSHQQYSSKH